MQIYLKRKIFMFDTYSLVKAGLFRSKLSNAILLLGFSFEFRSETV